MKFSTIATTLALAAGAATAATKRTSVPFTVSCNTADSFTDPNGHSRRCYVTSFALAAQGTPYPQDLIVILPPPVTPSYTGLTRIPAAGGQSTASVVGVIETFSWNGGVTDPIQIDFFVSQETAKQIEVLLSTGLHSLDVTSFGYYTENYDPTTQTWYSEAFPLNPVNLQGVIASSASNPLLSVVPQGEPIKVGSGIDVYKVSIKFLPAVHSSTLYIASSATERVAAAWGITVG